MCAPAGGGVCASWWVGGCLVVPEEIVVFGESDYSSKHQAMKIVHLSYYDSDPKKSIFICSGLDQLQTTRRTRMGSRHTHC